MGIPEIRNSIIQACLALDETSGEGIPNVRATDGMSGRGTDITAKLCRVNKPFLNSTLAQFAVVPQKREPGSRRIMRVQPPAATTSSIDAATPHSPLAHSNTTANNGPHRRRTTVVQELPAVYEDELTLPRPRLLVGEVLIWHDLENASRCIAQNIENWTFWAGIRVIFLNFVKARVVPLPYNLKIAHHFWSREIIGH